VQWALRPRGALCDVHPVKVSPRILRLLAVALLLLRVALFAFWFQTHGPYPRLGVSVDREGRVLSVLGPPALGVLETGDRLTRIGGHAIADPAVLEVFASDGRTRGPLAIEFERDGKPRQLVLPVAHLSALERFRVAAFPLLLAVVGPLVAFVLVWRCCTLPTAWVFQSFATISGLGVLSTVFPHVLGGMNALFEPWRPFYELVTSLYTAVFLHFMVLLPRPPWTSGSRHRSPWFALLAVAYLVPFAGWVARLLGADLPAPWPGQNYTSVVVIIGTGLLVLRYLRSGPDWTPTTGQRVLAVLVGATMLVSNLTFGDQAFDSWLASFVVLPWQRVAFTLLVTAWLATPLMLAYLIADDPAFHPRRLLAGGLPYLVLSTLVAALYLVVVVGLQKLFAGVAGENVFVLDLVAAIVLAILFAPLREFVQRTIDRIFDRDPSTLRAALDEAGARLLAALDRDEVRVAVETGLEGGLRRGVALHWSDTGAPSLVDPERVPDFARGPVRALLQQAAVRLDNLRLTAERAAATQAELRALQSQVQPHFLFNALNALAYLIEADPPAAQRFTDRLAGMLRYTVDAGRREAVLLSEEIAFVEDYLGVARERYENALEFRVEVEATDLSASVPPLLLQPLVENSLKHGLRPGASALHMTLRTQREDGRFVLSFEDDGVPDGHGAPGLGFGLENLTQRVRHFGGAGAEVQAGPTAGGGFGVRMAWPMVSGGRE
jgi:Histidine kinase